MSFNRRILLSALLLVSPFLLASCGKKNEAPVASPEIGIETTDEAGLEDDMQMDNNDVSATDSRDVDSSAEVTSTEVTASSEVTE